MSLFLLLSVVLYVYLDSYTWFSFRRLPTTSLVRRFAPDYSLTSHLLSNFLWKPNDQKDETILSNKTWICRHPWMKSSSYSYTHRPFMPFPPQMVIWNHFRVFCSAKKKKPKKQTWKKKNPKNMVRSKLESVDLDWLEEATSAVQERWKACFSSWECTVSCPVISL